MRKLNTADVFAALRLIRACGLREELKPLLKQAEGEAATAEDVGIDGVLLLVEMLSEKKTEQAVYEVLAGPLEKTAQEVAALPLDALASSLREIAEENDLKGFFGYVCGILGKK